MDRTRIDRSDLRAESRAMRTTARAHALVVADDASPLLPESERELSGVGAGYQ
jgi:hypothetical protein